MTIVAKRVIRRVHHHVAHFIAAVIRAPHAVIHRHRRARLAVQGRIARLGAVAELTIVAKRVIRRVHHHVAHFIAAVIRAPHAVIHRHRRARLAVQGRIARLGAVAELTIVAKRVIRRVHHHVAHFIAAVICTRHAVVHRHRNARLATEKGITSFGPVAELAVVAYKRARLITRPKAITLVRTGTRVCVIARASGHLEYAEARTAIPGKNVAIVAVFAARHVPIPASGKSG